MGGGPRRGRTGSTNIFVDQDDDMSFGGGMPGGMPRAPRHGHPNGRGRDHSPEKPAEITKPLKVSLRELYDGATKRLKVGRKMLNGTTEEKVLEIQILPGWKSGTKIRFPKAGNETSPGEAQDIVFVVEEKPDPVFRRDGNDLIAKVNIPLVEALTGVPSGKKQVDMLDGRRLQVTVPSGIVQPNQRSVVSGEGMPIRKDGQVRRKGDMIVEWNVVFPTSLTASQKEGLQKVLS
jgi:DnaJ family protein B protein 4